MKAFDKWYGDNPPAIKDKYEAEWRKGAEHGFKAALELVLDILYDNNDEETTDIIIKELKG